MNRSIPVSFVDRKYAETLEDVVLLPVEKDGMDFWWIDWQQGETAGGMGEPLWGLLEVPTGVCCGDCRAGLCRSFFFLKAIFASVF